MSTQGDYGEGCVRCMVIYRENTPESNGYHTGATQAVHIPPRLGLFSQAGPYRLTLFF